MSKVHERTAAALRAAAEHAVTTTHQNRARDLQGELGQAENATGPHSLHDQALDLLDDVICYGNSDPISDRELASLRRQYLAEAK